MFIKVDFKKKIKQEIFNFSYTDKEKILSFVSYVSRNGFNGLPGRSKKSDNVPFDDPNWLHKVRYAQSNNLWHYHIGIPEYDKTNEYGDWTSKYVLHYMIKGDTLYIVDFRSHPPFDLPPEDYLI